ncbi:MAG: lipopolysaccharide biosynthesis protein [Sphingomonadales bacterium]|nr:MAG: lipopolysaccharide biosynthesis protein [Sphingomonadales bacterium]
MSFPLPGGARLRARFAAILADGPVRSIGLLVGGTSAAHAITALMMPVNTRLYTPDNFAVAASFTSILAILSVVACLRFDMAIPLAEREEEAADLLGLSCLSAIGVTAIVTIALLLIPSAFLERLGHPGLASYLWLMPFAVLIAGLYLALQMWFVRKRQFGIIARTRVMQSALAASGQLGFGLAGRAPLGLIVGQVINYGAASFLLGLRILRHGFGLLRGISFAGMRVAFRNANRFLRYSVWEALANAASINVPILLIASWAAGPEAGYLTLAIFLLQAPMAVLGNAVAQVYVSDAPTAEREGRLAEFTRANLIGLTRAAMPPLIFLAIVAPAIFGFVFGASWVRAGELVTWMVPWFLMQFLTSPISTALHVLGRQRAAMVLQFGGLALRSGAVCAAAWAAPGWIAESYAVSGFVFYTLYLIVVMRVVGLGVGDFAVALRRSALLSALAAGVAVIVALAMHMLV